jgi:hypothetical protein
MREPKVQMHVNHVRQELILRTAQRHALVALSDSILPLVNPVVLLVCQDTTQIKLDYPHALQPNRVTTRLMLLSN